MKIEVKNINKSFNKIPVLKNVSLTIEDGEMLCLLGPSGAGKTTLIRLITGALKPDKGEIIMAENQRISLELLKKIGFMPQNDALYNDITGYQNLLFFGGLYGLKDKLLKERAEEVLSLMNLSADKNKLVQNYSGGMRKRLSLAIALLHKPDVLILDEPTVGIDPVLRKSIWDEFAKLSSEGITIVVSTHVMDEAVKCNKAALIYNGNLIEHGLVSDLLAKTKAGSLEELFFTAESDNKFEK